MNQVRHEDGPIRPYRTRVALEYAKLAYFALVVRCDGEIRVVLLGKVGRVGRSTRLFRQSSENPNVGAGLGSEKL